MSSFIVSVEVAASPEGPFERLQAVVDTGACYSWVPASVLRRLGLRQTGTRRFGLADGRIIERGITDVLVRLQGETHGTICVFGDEDTEALLGAVTLEEFALAADPVNERLLPMPKLPMFGFLPE